MAASGRASGAKVAVEPRVTIRQPVVVTHLAWFHGSVAVFVHNPHTQRLIQSALTKYTRTPDALEAGGDIGTGEKTVQFSELQPFASIVLAKIDGGGTTSCYRARVDKLTITNDSRNVVSLTLIDEGRFVQDVPIENLRPVTVLDSNVASLPPARPRFVQGFGVDDCHLNDPRQLYSAEVLDIVKNNRWTETFIDGRPLPNDLAGQCLLTYDTIPIVELVSLKGDRFYDLVAPHLQIDVRPPWLANCAFLLTCRPPISDGEEVSVLTNECEGQRLFAQLARYPVSELARLEAELEQLAQTRQLQPIKSVYSIEERLVAVPFLGQWKRGVVISTSGPRAVRVWVADYGCEWTVPRQELYYLPSDYADRFPPYGIQVDLRSRVASLPGRVCLRNIELKQANGAMIADLEPVRLEPKAESDRQVNTETKKSVMNDDMSMNVTPAKVLQEPTGQQAEAAAELCAGTLDTPEISVQTESASDLQPETPGHQGSGVDQELVLEEALYSESVPPETDSAQVETVMNVEVAAGQDQGAGNLLESGEAVVTSNSAVPLVQQTVDAAAEDIVYEQYEESNAVYEMGSHVVYDDSGQIVYGQQTEGELLYDANTGYEIGEGYPCYGDETLVEYQAADGIAYEDGIPVQYDGEAALVVPEGYVEDSAIYEGVETAYETEVRYEEEEQVYDQGANQVVYASGAGVGQEAGVESVEQAGQVGNNEDVLAPYNGGIEADYTGVEVYENGGPAGYVASDQSYSQGVQVAYEGAIEQEYQTDPQEVAYSSECQTVYDEGNPSYEQTTQQMGYEADSVLFEQESQQVYDEQAQITYDEEHPHAAYEDSQVYQQDDAQAYYQQQGEIVEEIGDKQYVYSDSTGYYAGEQEPTEYEAACVPEIGIQHADVSTSEQVVPNFQQTASAEAEGLSNESEAQRVDIEQVGGEVLVHAADSQISPNDEVCTSTVTGLDEAVTPIMSKAIQDEAVSYQSDALREAPTIADVEPNAAMAADVITDESRECSKTVQELSTGGFAEDGSSGECATGDVAEAAKDVSEAFIEKTQATATDDSASSTLCAEPPNAAECVQQQVLISEQASESVGPVASATDEAGVKNIRTANATDSTEPRIDIETDSCPISDKQPTSGAAGSSQIVTTVQVDSDSIPVQTENSINERHSADDEGTPACIHINDTVEFEVVSEFTRSAAIVVVVAQQTIVQDKLKAIVAGQSLKPFDFRDVRLDMVVLVTSKDEVPYRAIVTSINRLYVDVQLLDYGRQVRVQELFECPPELSALPQARCKLELLDVPRGPGTPRPLAAGRRLSVLCSLIQDDVVYGRLMN